MIRQGLQIEVESALEQFIPFADIAGGTERVLEPDQTVFDEGFSSSLLPRLGSPAHRCIFTSREYFKRLKRRKKMHDSRDPPGPSRLVARADPRAGVAMEVLVE
jgi:hypothetical protein